MTTTLEAPRSTADERLRAMVKPKPKAKEKTPTVSIPEAKDALEKLVEAKRVLANALAAVKIASAECIALVEPHRVMLSRERKECLSSMRVDELTYIVQNRYSRIKDHSADKPDDEDFDGRTLEEQEAALRALFGDRYEQFFLEIFTVEVDLKTLTDEQKEQLIAMDPKGERTLKPTKSFHDARTLDPVVALLAEEAHLTPVQYLTRK